MSRCELKDQSKNEKWLVGLFQIHFKKSHFIFPLQLHCIYTLTESELLQSMQCIFYSKDCVAMAEMNICSKFTVDVNSKIISANNK